MQSIYQREATRRANLRAKARTLQTRRILARRSGFRTADMIAAYTLTFGAGFIVGGAPLWFPLLMKAFGQ